MTSAQYLSNLGQEKAKAAYENLKNPVFYDVFVSLIGSSDKSLMSKGMTNDELDNVKNLIKTISDMDSFTAYVREAISDKEESLKMVSGMDISDWIKYSGHTPYPVAMDFQEWLEAENIKIPEVTLEEPKIPAPEETDIKVLVKKLPLKEYQEYLELDTRAAVLGKLCHSATAPFVIARQSLLGVIGKPLKKDGSGRDTCIYEHVPSLDVDKLETLFEGLQAKYRETEKKLNKIKFDLREAESSRYQSESAEYQKKLSAWNDAHRATEQEEREIRKKYVEYRNEIGRQQVAIRAEFEEWKVAERSRISKLKIIIPEALQSTYEYLESLGKKEEQEKS